MLARPQPPPRFEVKAPAGAPNVLDRADRRHGLRPVERVRRARFSMPTVESLASAGLRYNQFHTTALCSPTRAALLSGRNHHVNNMGSITETATAFPGQTGQRPNSVAPAGRDAAAERLQHGRLRQVARDGGLGGEPLGPDRSLADPLGLRQVLRLHRRRDQPVGAGALRRDEPVELPKDPNYQLHDRHDQPGHPRGSSTRSRSRRTSPSSSTFAPGATHAPHHVPKSWIAKYKGKFDQGWDALREQTLARQKRLGVVPPETKLAPKPAGHQGLGRAERGREEALRSPDGGLRRFGEYADTEVGRLIKAIEDTGQLDNTLIFYIVGDNGASAEGGMSGLFNEYDLLQSACPKPFRTSSSTTTSCGGPDDVSGTMPPGWAVAGDTPFTWTKQIASSYGGTRNGMVVHWPKGIKAKGELRSQWHSRHRHRADHPESRLACRSPRRVNGTVADAHRGREPRATRSRTRRPRTAHTTQYFEIFGNRRDLSRRLAGRYRSPGGVEFQVRRPFEERQVGALRGAVKTSAWRTILAAKNPEKLEGDAGALPEERRLKYSVLPLDDRLTERLQSPRLVGRLGPDGRAHVADGLRRHDRDDGERLHQPEEPLAR